MVERAKITVKGIVQGVGFRPYVYTLADSLNLRGYVTNTADGVSIDAEGEHLSDFIARLPAEAPELSKIFEVSVSPLPAYGYTEFRIVRSNNEGRFTLISQDVSVCEQCRKELFDPADRRFLYPFINCTHCGPRFSITRSIPYDRPNTTMSVFTMCPACNAEYHDPKDRRFHAQPNACSKCGPHITLVKGLEPKVRGEEAIEIAIALLKEGKIIAVKGIGGFHIACDARNEHAVMRLRERKRRSNKPFALMAAEIKFVEKFCEVSDEEKGLLLSLRRPIVLLKKKEGGDLPVAVSPHNRYLGFMLPYTPLHYLLFYHPTASCTSRLTVHAHFEALVMTSGNLSEEPIVVDNDEAMEKLAGIADAFLLHDRDIFMRVDDSVVRTIDKTRRDAQDTRRDSELPVSHCPEPTVSLIRRSRGYTPEPVALPDDGPEVLGCGADIKNTFTLTKGKFAIPSQHIGDMENYETLRFFEESLRNLKSVYRAEPVAIAHDLHPGYLSTRWALEQGKEHRTTTIGIQHHYGHIGSVMAEHGLTGKVIGIAFDGSGYGTDGNFWGSEFLVVDAKGFERAGHFRYVPLPGGEAAIKEPWRTAVSYIADAAGQEATDYLASAGFMEKYGAREVGNVIKLIPLREFSPLSSGAGRLFDAVSALLGLCDRNTFEGEAAIALESLVIGDDDEEYPFDISRGCEGKSGTVVDFSRAMMRICADLFRGVDRRVISARFHNTVSSAIVRMARGLSETHGLDRVALSGGAFQNLLLLDRTVKSLRSWGMTVFLNERVPCNDGGISLGQAYLCRERLKTEQ